MKKGIEVCRFCVFSIPTYKGWICEKTRKKVKATNTCSSFVGGGEWECVKKK